MTPTKVGELDAAGLKAASIAYWDHGGRALSETSPDRLNAAIRAYLALAAPVDHPEVVGVKALEWEEMQHSHGYRARGIDRWYVIALMGGEWVPQWDVTFAAMTLDAAKAAAQADYETRIRSALQPSDSPALRPLPAPGEEAAKYCEARGPKWTAAFNALREYRMSNMACEDGEPGYPFVDLVSRDGEGVSIADGEFELVSITDEIMLAIGADSPALEAGVATLPRLTESMMRAACKAHYGDDNIDGIDLTAYDRNWSFRDGFKRMWAGIRKSLDTAALSIPAKEPGK